MNFEANFGFKQKNDNELVKSAKEDVTVMKDWEDLDLPEEIEAEKVTVEFEGEQKGEGGSSYLIFKDFGQIPGSKVPDLNKIRPGDKFEIFTKTDTAGNNKVADIVMIKNLSTGNKMVTSDWKDSAWEKE